MLKIIQSSRSGHLQPVDNQDFTPHSYPNIPVLDIDRSIQRQTLQGFGISFTDAACYMLSRLPETARSGLLREIFGKDGLNLSMGRLNIGSSDYSTKVYSYNDTPDDVEMKNFSIAHDRKYIIPAVQEALTIRPDLFLFAAPWSPPAWMKSPAMICGGYMRAKYLPALANYLCCYLEAYRKEGINIQALTMQNEPETSQNGNMPQSLLHPDMEMELIGHLMPSEMKKRELSAALWLYDHNYSGWRRVLYMLDDPEVAANCQAVAWHPYDGDPKMIRTVKEKYPEKEFHLTEKGPNLRQDSPESSIDWWGDCISGALNNFCRSFCGWNLALDEKGTPNLGVFDCAGMVEINSQTLEIRRSVQYYALKHFAPYLKKGAVILECDPVLPMPPGVRAVIGRNTDGSYAAVVTNRNEKTAHLQLKNGKNHTRLILPGKSLSTILF